MNGLRAYVALARPDHWFKNIFVLPGTGIAALLLHAPPRAWAVKLALGLASACLIASANYVINEWLDAEFDRHHPLKRLRPSVAGKLRPAVVWSEYAGLLAAGLGLGFLISPGFLRAAAVFGLMGVAYNVRPLRSKDRPYVDVLSEALNNPIRLGLGWFVVTEQPPPPSSLVLGYWMAGAFLMAVKRHAELRFLGNPELAGRYRRSFRFYTEESLLISIFFYGACASFFLGVFLVKYRLELLLSLPFLALLFAWYLRLGLKANSPTQRPEQLYRELPFAAYTVFVVLLVSALFVVDVPGFERLLDNAFLTSP